MKLSSTHSNEGRFGQGRHSLLHAHVSKLYFSEKLKVIMLQKCAAGFWQSRKNINDRTGNRSGVTVKICEA